MPQAEASAGAFTHAHNYYNSPPSTAWTGTVADSIGLGLALIVVVARCYTKYRITKTPGWEDYFSIMALVTFIVFWALDIVQRCLYGGGRHLYDIPPPMFYGYFWNSVIVTYMYIIGVCFAKLSLLLFLYRIFKIDRLFRIASWILGAVLVVWTTTTMLLCIFACRPIRASWDLNLMLQPTTDCPIKAYNVVNIQGFCNIITDFALLVLPIPMTWTLNVPGRKRLGVFAVFGTGILICAVAIARQYLNYHADKNGDDYYLYKVKVLISLEFSLSIVVASLPVLTPLFKKPSVVAFWFPSIGSKRSDRPKISAPKQDLERGAEFPDEKSASTPWQVPTAWRDDGYESASPVTPASDKTLQDLSGHLDNQHGQRP